MATYLLTGATGFLGGHVLRELISAKQKVVLLSRQPLPHLEHDNIKVVIGDILDQDSVERAAKGCDGLFHCAGMVSRDRADAKKMMEVNVTGTCRTLDGAKAAGVKRVVYASTSGTVAISEDGEAISNEHTSTPIGLIGRWPYYRSKLFAEQEALKRNQDDFEVVSINPSLLIGPGDLRGHSTIDIQWFLQKKVFAVPSGGLSFVDVRDVAQVMLSAMRKGRAGSRYLVGACNLTFEEYFGRLSRLSGVEVPALKAPRNRTLNTIGNILYSGWRDAMKQTDGPDEESMDMASYFWYLDATLAERELDFNPRDPLTTLNETIKDLREWEPHYASGADQTLRMKYHLLEGLSIASSQIESQARQITERAKQAVTDILQ